MTMEAAADTQSGETAVSESETQQLTLAQVSLIVYKLKAVIRTVLCVALSYE